MQADNYVQLNIFGTTVEEIRDKLGVFDNLNGLDFTLLEFSPPSLLQNSQSTNDDRLVDPDEVKNGAFGAERNANLDFFNSLGTSTFSMAKEMVYKKVLEFGNFDSEGIVKFNELFNWIHSKGASRNRQDMPGFSSNSDHAASVAPTVHSLDNTSLSNINISQFPTSDRSFLDMDGTSASMQNFIHSMDMFFKNTACGEVKAKTYSNVLDISRGYGDSVLSVMNKIMGSVSQNNYEKRVGESLYAKLDISPGVHLDLSDKDDCSSQYCSSEDDENDISYHDATSEMVAVDKQLVSHDMAYSSRDSNNYEFVPDVDDILESMQRDADYSEAEKNNDSLWIETGKPENGPEGLIGVGHSRSFIKTEDVESVASLPSSSTNKMDDNNENGHLRRRTRRKKRKCVTKGRFRKHIICSFEGCNSHLSFRAFYDYWPRLFRHAESHAVVSCEHCDFTCNSQRMAFLHHKKKHSDVVFNKDRNKCISQHESNLLMDVCFPSELQRKT